MPVAAAPSVELEAAGLQQVESVTPTPAPVEATEAPQAARRPPVVAPEPVALPSDLVMIETRASVAVVAPVVEPEPVRRRAPRPRPAPVAPTEGDALVQIETLK